MQENNKRQSIRKAGYSPGIFSPLTFTPQTSDYSILREGFKEQDTYRANTAAQQSAVEAAIAQTELNDSEDEWKQNYINDIKTNIDSAIEIGDYAGAFQRATRLAGKVATDPALRGRERYQKKYSEYLTDLEKQRDSGRITDDTYKRALDLNKYAYQDVTNAEGTIVGGSNFTPEFDPVRDVSIVEIMQKLKAFITPNSTTTNEPGSVTEYYTDKNYPGQFTHDPEEADELFLTNTKGGSQHQYQGITEAQFIDAYHKLLAAEPELANSLKQKYENEVWKADKGDLIALNNITNERGQRISDYQTWIHKQFEPYIRTMAYSQTSDIQQPSGFTRNIPRTTTPKDPTDKFPTLDEIINLEAINGKASSIKLRLEEGLVKGRQEIENKIDKFRLTIESGNIE